MAKIIADALEGELSVVLVHKIPAPGNEELAIGAIGLSGNIQRLPSIETYSIPDEYVQTAAKQQVELLKTRQQKYGLKEPDYQDRIVIIVDDGIATGATTLSAVYEVRNFKPKKIILATPVASVEAAEKLSKVVDELIVLDTPWEFYAVGQFYDVFNQVSDEEVIGIIKNSDRKIKS